MQTIKYDIAFSTHRARDISFNAHSGKYPCGNEPRAINRMRVYEGVDQNRERQSDSLTIRFVLADYKKRGSAFRKG